MASVECKVWKRPLHGPTRGPPSSFHPTPKTHYKNKMFHFTCYHPFFPVRFLREALLTYSYLLKKLPMLHVEHS
jgi:hypothetical protein